MCVYIYNVPAARGSREKIRPADEYKGLDRAAIRVISDALAFAAAGGGNQEERERENKSRTTTRY